MMAWLDALATVKDVGEAVAWAIGRSRIGEWEARVGRRRWILRLVGVLGISVGTYCSRHSDLMDWLGHIASVKDASEAVVWAIGEERLEGWGGVVLNEGRYR